MPYILPSRSRSQQSFSNVRGRGTFVSLGALPKRDTSTKNKQHVFHFSQDDDDNDDNDDSTGSLESNQQKSTIQLPAVPFPTQNSPSPRPNLQRGLSSPILLSNGKPLKSSLKSSSSSPSISPALSSDSSSSGSSTPVQSYHLRARSEPSTPKNVHFPDLDSGLATVKLFSRSARPAALSLNTEETETDGEGTADSSYFDTTPRPAPPILTYSIDSTRSSPIPAQPPSASNVLLESLAFQSTTPTLKGTVLIHNIAYEKHVAIRFTLDDWQTVSEVRAEYVTSLSSSTPVIPPTIGDLAAQLAGKPWDRFAFSIRLEDYARTLGKRTMFLAARFRTEMIPPAEWWDNNGGKNYCVAFKAEARQGNTKGQPSSVPFPSTSSRVPFPSTALRCEHAQGQFSSLRSPSPPSPPSTPVPFPSTSTSVSPPTSPRTRKENQVHVSALTIPLPQRVPFPSINPGGSNDSGSSSPASSTLSTPTSSPLAVPSILEPSGLPSGSPLQTYMQHMRGGPYVHSQLRTDYGGGRDHLYEAFVNQWCFAQSPAPYTNMGVVGGS